VSHQVQDDVLAKKEKKTKQTTKKRYE